MVWVYIAKLELLFKKRPKNMNVFIDTLLKRGYADYTILHIEKNKSDKVIVTYKFNAGAEITNLSGWVSIIINGDPVFREFMKDISHYDILAESVFHEEYPDYLKYLAYKYDINETPLDIQEFLNRTVNGEYWKNL